MTRSERRAVTLGAVVVLAALLGLRVVPWAIRALGEARHRHDARLELLAASRSVIASAPRLGDSAKVLTQAVESLAPRILSGNSEAKAMEDLASRLEHLARKHHLRLDRVDPVRDSATAGLLRRVSAQTTLEGDIRGLTGLLADLSQDQAVVVPRRLRISAPDPTSAPSRMEALRVELVLSAWYQPREEGV